LDSRIEDFHLSVHSHVGHTPAVTAQRLYDVLYNLSIRGSAWLTRSVRRKKMKIERTDTGLIELRLSEDPEQFVRLAEEVRTKLGGRWTEKIDGLDQSYWDLDVQGIVVTVHREHYLGVSVFGKDEPGRRSVLEKLQNGPEPATTK
jgi:hypothetical protein